VSRLRLPVAASWVAVASLVLAACGNGGDAPFLAAAEEAAALRLQIPARVVGLAVEPEEIPQAGVESVDQPYADSIVLFGLREGALLRGTLQVTRLNQRARPGDRDFRDQVVSQISAVEPFKLNLGGTEVYATGGTEQNIYVWFKGRGLMVLAVHQDFAFPRTLLRRFIDAEMGL
jgi:hypothetical protein